MALVYNVLSHHVLKRGDLKIYFSDTNEYISIDIEDNGSSYYEYLAIHYLTLKELLETENNYKAYINIHVFDKKFRTTKTFQVSTYKDLSNTIFQIHSSVSDISYERWQFREDEIEYLLKLANEKG